MEQEGAMQSIVDSVHRTTDALMHAWARLDDVDIEALIKEQQGRLKQVAERTFLQSNPTEGPFDGRSQIILDTVHQFENANRQLYEHWDTIPVEQRQELLQKQLQRLEELRKRLQ